MKRLYYIATLAIALFASLPIQAQEEAGNTQQQQQRRRGPEASRGAREEEKKENGMPELTVRAQDMNERMTQHIGNARWMRVIYRFNPRICKRCDSMFVKSFIDDTFKL